MLNFFITGNPNKFREAKLVMPELEQFEVDLPEIQNLNPKMVIQAKLEEAAKHKPEGALVVEDTSLCLDALNGFPGPLIKWFMEAVDLQRIYELVESLGNRQATARTIVGYRTPDGQSMFFEGVLNGTIVAPQGETSFGWDPIFQPDGFAVTFAEMDEDEKIQFSMRTEAFRKLQSYLDRQAKN